MKAEFTVKAITKYDSSNSGVRVELEPRIPATLLTDPDFWAGKPNGIIELYLSATTALNFNPAQNYLVSMTLIP